MQEKTGKAPTVPQTLIYIYIYLCVCVKTLRSIEALFGHQLRHKKTACLRQRGIAIHSDSPSFVVMGLRVYGCWVVGFRLTLEILGAESVRGLGFRVATVEYSGHELRKVFSWQGWQRNPLTGRALAM